MEDCLERCAESRTSSFKPEGDDFLSTAMEFSGVLFVVPGPRPGEVNRESTASSPKPKDDDLLSTAMEFSGILFVVPGAIAWTLQPSCHP